MVATKRLRENIVAVRMTDAEASLARELAEIDGLSVSDVLRVALRRAHADRFGTMRVEWLATRRRWRAWLNGRWVELDPTIPKSDEAAARMCAGRVHDEARRTKEVE